MAGTSARTNVVLTGITSVTKTFAAAAVALMAVKVKVISCPATTGFLVSRFY